MNVILAELHLWVHDASKIVGSGDLKEHNFSLAKRYLNIELAYLGDLCQQVANFYFDIDFDKDSHRLVIVHVVVTLSKLCEVHLISV